MTNERKQELWHKGILVDTHADSIGSSEILIASKDGSKWESVALISGIIGKPNVDAIIASIANYLESNKTNA